jgi:hypothetical protein
MRTGGEAPVMRRQITIKIDSDRAMYRDKIRIIHDASTTFGHQCIIQDSHTDWKTEAAKMGSYYTNAFITIAASSSKTSAARHICGANHTFGTQANAIH